MSNLLSYVRPLAVGFFALGFALSAQAAPEMFEASFVWHAFGNDVSSGTAQPYTANTWSGVPLGNDCQHAEPYTVNGDPSTRYCTAAINQRGHPATGMWSRNIGTGTPPRITMQKSDFGVHLYTFPLGTDTDTPHCCRGFNQTYPPYLQSWTYATFVNATGSFFANGGAAAGVGYNNKMPKNPATAGTWHIRAGKNAFGGAMGLLGQYGGRVMFSFPGKPTISIGTSNWAMAQPVGRGLYQTQIDTGDMGTPIWQNPFSTQNTWYGTTPKGKVNVSSGIALGSGTLWTTGQVGNFAKTGAYYSSIWRTGYDNRTPGGRGNIQLVTPTLTHWLSPSWNSHTVQLAMLKIQVPEPGAVLLLVAGGGVLGLLYQVSRRA